MLIKERLFTPGPVPLPPQVIKALGQQIIHHRTPEFTNAFLQVREKLQKLLKTKRDVLMFASSGTGAMEASIVNFFSEEDTVLVINAGKFGQRWREIAKRYNLKVIDYEIPWGKTYDKEKLIEILGKYPQIKGILVQQSETSTTTYHDVKFLAEKANEMLEDCLIVVDGITSVGVYEVYPEEVGIDILVTGSQKALMLPPGLSILYYSEKAEKRLDTSNLPKYYFDVKAESKKQAKGQTAYTPAINLILALNESLNLILDEGLENLAKRHEVMAKATREAVQELGLKLLSESPANSATGVYAPEGINADDLRKQLLKIGFRVAGGQDHLKGKIFRIAHMGYFDFMDMIQVIAGLEIALQKIGYPVEFGKAVSKAQEIIREVL
ncbi:pyridoxal-phosphate-dependent aminotransferase family protein [Hydrogenothermus marinus]|uniref:Aspartate aminotransferase-like enzyme n=1 Tax=Hydrogenothermus marinus TaxID=133270 RepID=A0A3M0BEL1_9AQUI|nr:alanine--glyoxylate aminotransferase family protein [Hydrogenothermus marinus]RMA93025.1 aspartate aminotransferase-like enzyme [Hydrogenothermus marinus]